MLVELGVAEQRYRAVLEVLDEGASVTDVARRYGVARQTVHDWLRRYVNDGGLAGLVDRSSRPQACPHQMSAVIEARVVKLRREHPAWGPSRIVWQLERTGVVPVPGRSSVYRALVRHGLVEAAHRPTGARSPTMACGGCGTRCLACGAIPGCSAATAGRSRAPGEDSAEGWRWKHDFDLNYLRPGNWSAPGAGSGAMQRQRKGDYGPVD